jgi:hypothetical protein
MIRSTRLGALLVIALAVPGAAAAQSDEVRIIGNVGLGRPAPPIDARARGMGGAATTMHGVNLSMINPASTISILVPGVWIAFSGESREVDGTVAQGEINTAEFPLVRMVIPFENRHAVGVGFGSYLNQDWRVQFFDTLQLVTGPVAFRETRESEGGVGQFRLDFATRLSREWTLGIGGIYYFGKSGQSVEREFETSAGFSPYEAQDAIKYSGLGMSVGAEWRPIPEMIFGATGNWGLGLNVKSDSTGAEKEFDQPLALDLGASWQLTPDFVLAFAAGWTNWSTISDDLPRPGSADHWRFNLGTELRVLGNENTRVLARVGGRLAQLPFKLRRGPPWERALTLGVGTMFRAGLGRFDIAFEVGKRGQKDTNEIEENFTRWTFTLAVFTR